MHPNVVYSKNMRISELFFLLAGIGILISFPFLAGMGLYFWIAAKIAYLLGVIFYVREFVWKP